MITLHHGNCLDILPTLPAESVDSCVCDPPYHLTSGNLAVDWGSMAERSTAHGGGGPRGPTNRAGRKAGFMGQQWDGGDIAFRPEVWREVLRVLKPGGHLLAFSGTRTQHRMVCAIEGVGFEIRDQIGWLYGSGFPKSLDVAMAIAKKIIPGWEIGDPYPEESLPWMGYGTALKPSYEPVTVAQKPYTPQGILAILVPTVWELICKIATCEKTDTPLFGLLRTSGFLSIAGSLSNSLAALLGQESKCTIETAFVLTTDLKTLQSSLSRIMHAITIQGGNLIDGVECDAWGAAATSKSAQANFARLQSTTAGEIVIDWHAQPGSDPAGSSIRPAWEPICLARKPLIGTVAANVVAHGTGALNIEKCRIPTDANLGRFNNAKPLEHCVNYSNPNAKPLGRLQQTAAMIDNSGGARWPANICHDGSDEVLAAFAAFGESKSAGRFPKNSGGIGTATGIYGKATGRDQDERTLLDTGTAARFFFSAKASREERGIGHVGTERNGHPTVKPLDLMQWLCRLVTPPGGTVLDPFLGSGSTLVAADREGFHGIGIELSAEYLAIARRRFEGDAGLFAEIA